MTTKFPNGISAVSLSNGDVVDGSSGDVVNGHTDWDKAPVVSMQRTIDFNWYAEQRTRLAAYATQVSKVHESLTSAWYKVIRRSLNDLPIRPGGRSVQDPYYGRDLRAIGEALGLAPSTLSNYRTAVSRIRDDVHFRELISTGLSWSQIVFALGRSPARHVRADGSQEAVKGYANSMAHPLLPPARQRFIVQVPTQTSDFLIDHGLEGSDVTAVVVSYLRQPQVQRALLKLFRSSEATG